MIFDFNSQEDDLACAMREAGVGEPCGTRHVLQRTFWRYFTLAWSGACLWYGGSAAMVGFVLIGLVHPVWVGMRMADLAQKNRIVHDSGRHEWFVSIGGIDEKEKILSLKNILFHSPEDMHKVLTGFCRQRVLIYVFALLWACYDLVLLGQGALAGHSWLALAWAMALANVVFFAQRSMKYYPLLQMGLRQDWRVGTVTVDSSQMFTAYKLCRRGDVTFYLPYLLAILIPKAA